MVTKVTSLMSRLAARRGKDEDDPEASSQSQTDGSASGESQAEESAGGLRLGLVHALGVLLFVLTVALAFFQPHAVALVLFMIPAAMAGRLGALRALGVTLTAMVLSVGVYVVTEGSLLGPDGGVTLVALLTLILLTGVGSPWLLRYLETRKNESAEAEADNAISPEAAEQLAAAVRGAELEDQGAGMLASLVSTLGAPVSQYLELHKKFEKSQEEPEPVQTQADEMPGETEGEVASSNGVVARVVTGFKERLRSTAIATGESPADVDEPADAQAVAAEAPDSAPSDPGDRLIVKVARVLKTYFLSSEFGVDVTEDDQIAASDEEQDAGRMERERAAEDDAVAIIRSGGEPETMYDGVARALARVVRFEKVTINSVDPDANTLTDVFQGGLQIDGRPVGESTPLAGTFSASVIEAGTGLLVQPKREREIASTFPSLMPNVKAGIRSFMAVPLFADDRPVGSLHLRSGQKRAFSDEDLALVERVAEPLARAMAGLPNVAPAAVPVQRSAYDPPPRPVDDSSTTPAQPATATAPVGPGPGATAQAAPEDETPTPDLGPGLSPPAELESPGSAREPAVGEPGLSLEEVEELKAAAVAEVEGRYADQMEELEAELVKGQALTSLATGMAAVDTVEAVHSVLTRGLGGVVRYEALVLFELDEAESNAFAVLVDETSIPGWEKGTNIVVAGTPFETVVSQRKPFVSCVAPAEFGAVSSVLRPLGEAGIASVALTPMASGGRVRGVIALMTTTRDAYTEGDLDEVVRAGGMAASTIETVRRSTQARAEAALASALSEISKKVGSSLDENDVCARLAEATASIFKHDRLVVTRLDRASGELTHNFVSGEQLEGERPTDRLSLAGTATEEALRDGHVVLASGPSGGEAARRYGDLGRMVEAGFISFLAAPLVADGERLGSMLVAARADGSYSARSADILGRIAEQVAPAIRNARQHATSVAPNPVNEMERVVWTSSDVSGMLGDLALRLGALVPFERFAVWAVDVPRGTLVNSYTAVRSGDTWIPTAPQAPVALVDAASMTNGAGGVASPQRLAEVIRGIVGGQTSSIPVPLFYADEAVGLVSVTSSAESAFTPEHETTVVSLAGALGIRMGLAHAGVQSQMNAQAMQGRLAHFEQTTERQAGELQTATRELSGLRGALYGDLRESLDTLGSSARSMARLVDEKSGGLGDADRLRLRQIVVSGHAVSRTLDSVSQMRRFEEAAPSQQTVDLTALARSLAETMRENDPGRVVDVSITEGLAVQGDPEMVGALLQHLIANAWTHTEGRPKPRVQVGVMQQNGLPAFYIKDNGDGTDQTTAQVLVGERPANGMLPQSNMGLAVARKVVERHGGSLQVLTEDGVGTTVFFSLYRQPAAADQLAA